MSAIEGLAAVMLFTSSGMTISFPAECSQSGHDDYRYNRYGQYLLLFHSITYVDVGCIIHISTYKTLDVLSKNENTILTVLVKNRTNEVDIVGN